MFKTMIAGVAALALTITPLQAEEFNEDALGKLLFGLVAAGIVATALKNRDDTHVAPRVHQPTLPPAYNLYDYEPPVVQHRGDHKPPRINPGRGNNRGGLPTAGNGRGHNAKVLPGQCFKSVQTRIGSQNMFARHCLTQNFRYAARLPQKCAVRIIARNTAHNGFDPFCLRREGYTSTHRQ